MASKNIFILACLLMIQSLYGQILEGVSNKYTFNLSENYVPPNLILSDEVSFEDENGNNILNAKENAHLRFSVYNKGGDGYDLFARVNIENEIKGLNFIETIKLPTIKSGTSKTFSIQLSGAKELKTGNAVMSVHIVEPKGFNSNEVKTSFKTKEYDYPDLVVNDFIISTANGSDIKKNEPFTVKANIQNIGAGDAREVYVSVDRGKDNGVYCSQDYFKYANLASGESKEIEVSLTIPMTYKKDYLDVILKVSEYEGKFGTDKNIKVELGMTSSPKLVTIKGEEEERKKIERSYLTSEVDRNIPKLNNEFENKFALIIGNEDYSTYSPSLKPESDVMFAENDAKSFSNYLTSVYGYKDENVFVLKNQTSAQTQKQLLKFTELVKNYELNKGKTEVVFYYAGHGMPSSNDSTPYIVPVDVSAETIEEGGIPLKEIYNKLISTNSDKITVFLDACFTGEGRNQGLVTAARSLTINAKHSKVNGNLIVISSSTAKQKSYPYEKENHGIFTYYLLKCVKDSKGDITLSDLFDCIKFDVNNTALREHGTKQNPVVNISDILQKTWMNWKL